ncbi:MAG: hypothetical protein M3Q10_08830 [Chloroflexota bacterium]|nr:hypothetical protein [Chloroflexota bacterium]
MIPLNALGDFIGVWFARESDRGIVEFAVQYQIRLEGQERQVLRYDGAHGYAHRDLLDWHGNVIRKTPMREGIGYGEALTEAIDDIQEHWFQYRTRYLERRP